MREIKFRVWDEEMKIMTFVPDKNAEAFCLKLPLKNVMQYTGLHDKNGKEIYEGDLIKWGIHIDEVIWQINGYVFSDEGFRLSSCNEKAEVIGNIYENPNLPETSVGKR